jgi:nucleoside-triphosphatase
MRRVREALPGLAICGFITDEIRTGGRREGFRLETFNGESAVLAHTGIRSPYRVGRYGVDVTALDRVVDAALMPVEGVDLYLIDEIGKMECFSERFVAAIQRLLDSAYRIVATIHRGAGGFAGQVKRRPEVDLWEVTLQNRDELVGRVLAWIGR